LDLDPARPPGARPGLGRGDTESRARRLLLGIGPRSGRACRAHAAAGEDVGPLAQGHEAPRLGAYLAASAIILTSSSGRAPMPRCAVVVRLVGSALTPIFCPGASHFSTGALQLAAGAGSFPVSMKS